jgi:type I pantothenate kinase
VVPDVAALVDLLFVPATRFAPRPDDPDDTAAVYGPLADWLGERAAAAHGGFEGPAPQRDEQIGTKPTAVRGAPFVVGVAGGIAVGKTTIAEHLGDLLRRGGEQQVAVISADGFLFPNAELAARGLIARKGFPESYDTAALYLALATLKAGRPAPIPRYSHLSYDVVPGTALDPPDVVVVEGINVLQVPADSTAAVPSDLIDVGLYLDAAEPDLRRWYGERLAELFVAARHEPASFYHQWSSWDAPEVTRFADAVWESINVANLRHHIAPSRLRAEVIVEKGADHRVSGVLVRRR